MWVTAPISALTTGWLAGWLAHTFEDSPAPHQGPLERVEVVVDVCVERQHLPLGRLDTLEDGVLCDGACSRECVYYWQLQLVCIVGVCESDHEYTWGC